ncbi:MAG: hypothetical protein K0Q55_1274 [Verrucomicrobia bacterium]|jgi:hypothetical protein|nr:hypothetical protein [Verrucomicrobiota bacterium]
MKRWAVIMTLAYALLWVVLAYPVWWLALHYEWSWSLDDAGRFSLDANELFSAPFFWVVFGTVVVCQAALLIVPVEVGRERLKARRGILWPATAIALLFANLVFWGVNSLLLLVADLDTVFAPIEFLSDALQQSANQGLASRLTGAVGGIDVSWYEWTALSMFIGGIWLLWGGVFYRFYRTSDAESWTRRWLKNLFRGSVLELLVVLPTHIVLRSKDDCCAPMVSFMGIVTGLSVMVICFGPGVMFLYLDRARRLKPKVEQEIRSETTDA